MERGKANDAVFNIDDFFAAEEAADAVSNQCEACAKLLHSAQERREGVCEPCTREDQQEEERELQAQREKLGREPLQACPGCNDTNHNGAVFDDPQIFVPGFCLRCTLGYGWEGVQAPLYNKLR